MKNGCKDKGGKDESGGKDENGGKDGLLVMNFVKNGCEHRGV